MSTPSSDGLSQFLLFLLLCFLPPALHSLSILGTDTSGIATYPSVATIHWTLTPIIHLTDMALASSVRIALLVTAASAYKLPDFSWNTLPVAWHSAVPAKELAPADIAVLRKYVCLFFYRCRFETLEVMLDTYLTRANTSVPSILPRRYPLVTLEKTTGADTLHWDPSTLKWRVPITCQVGSDVTKCGCCQEDNFVRHATQLKAANPRQHIVAYMNTEIAYPWYRYVVCARGLVHPLRFLLTSAGALTTAC